jgi:hypothetical protein
MKLAASAVLWGALCKLLHWAAQPRQALDDVDQQLLNVQVCVNEMLCNTAPSLRNKVIIQLL